MMQDCRNLHTVFIVSTGAPPLDTTTCRSAVRKIEHELVKLVLAQVCLKRLVTACALTFRV